MRDRVCSILACGGLVAALCLLGATAQGASAQACPPGKDGVPLTRLIDGQCADIRSAWAEREVLNAAKLLGIEATSGAASAAADRRLAVISGEGSRSLETAVAAATRERCIGAAAIFMSLLDTPFDFMLGPFVKHPAFVGIPGRLAVEFAYLCVLGRWFR